MDLPPGDGRFGPNDLCELTDLVTTTWLAAADRDWSARAGTLDWSCLETADHAVDCVYAPAIFLASRKTDGYPELGAPMTLGAEASPERLVQSLEIATRLLVSLVNGTPSDVRAAIFRFPEVTTAGPGDFVPRAAVELILHAHDVCAGLAVPFEPPLPLCRRLRDHTRHWPMWTLAWNGLDRTDDPWSDLLAASGRQRLPA